ncbi:hypothetical protein AURDEDRAFT_172120 [Auricularia subglabra TFB-10046 SS5]|nr:hypothetical protein AURDEDRAFT_172120 [Auricularia subglabra TFB-10046 SS5]
MPLRLHRGRARPADGRLLFVRALNLPLSVHNSYAAYAHLAIQRSQDAVRQHVSIASVAETRPSASHVARAPAWTHSHPGAERARSDVQTAWPSLSLAGVEHSAQALEPLNGRARSSAALLLIWDLARRAPQAAGGPSECRSRRLLVGTASWLRRPFSVPAQWQDLPSTSFWEDLRIRCLNAFWTTSASFALVYTYLWRARRTAASQFRETSHVWRFRVPRTTTTIFRYGSFGAGLPG